MSSFLHSSPCPGGNLTHGFWKLGVFVKALSTPTDGMGAVSWRVCASKGRNAVAQARLLSARSSASEYPLSGGSEQGTIHVFNLYFERMWSSLPVSCKPSLVATEGSELGTGDCPRGHEEEALLPKSWYTLPRDENGLRKNYAFARLFPHFAMNRISA